MGSHRFWWPLDLSKKEQEANDLFSKALLSSSLSLNTNTYKSCLDALDLHMRATVTDIIEKDGLPHHCHLINGWGNSIFKGRGLMEIMEMFAHKNHEGKYFILQCDSEGDFHPWQSFAYAVMAGVDPNLPLSSKGTTLSSLAKYSREINTDEGIELGHLLFAFAYIEPTIDAPPFFLKGKEHNVKTLMDLAVDAHHYGSFRVCRKFHLTEGLCAAASKVRGLEDYRALAQGFLDGQLDMLLLLGVILKEARKAAEQNRKLQPDDLIQVLRQSLRLGSLIENHCYYAGHLIELAIFAASLGYKIKKVHWLASIYIINEINNILPSYLPYLSLQDHFYAVGHYRRAITLLNEWQVLSAGETLDNKHLQKFIINFDKISLDDIPLRELASKPASIKEGGIFDISAVIRNPRSRFISVINSYNSLAVEELKPRGKFDHFRRIGPASWPRSLHYEILDYKDKIGIEIHIENESLHSIRENLKNLEGTVQSLFSDKFVEWDPAWNHGFGRIRVLFEDTCAVDEVVRGIVTLINATFPKLDPLARELDSRPLKIV